jgi:hypothetical protein
VAELVKWLLVALLVVNAAGAVLSVGKPREPITPGSALRVVVVNMLVVAAVFAFWGGGS